MSNAFVHERIYGGKYDKTNYKTLEKILLCIICCLKQIAGWGAIKFGNYKIVH